MTPEPEAGSIESAQRLVHAAGRQWKQQDLLAAAERAVLRNTGWPIGLVIRSPDLAPVPTPDGIEARLRHYTADLIEDFWSLRADASYYVSRLFEEDLESEHRTNVMDSQGYPERFIWFDTRIWRIAEVILHSAVLYRELGIPPDEPYVLAVNHQRLEEREFYASNPHRFVIRGRFCRSPMAAWTREVTQDYVTSNLKGLIKEVAGGVFVLFDFATMDEGVVDGIVDEFLRSQV